MKEKQNNMQMHGLLETSKAKRKELKRKVLTRRVHTLWETDFGGHWRVDF